MSHRASHPLLSGRAGLLASFAFFAVAGSLCCLPLWSQDVTHVEPVRTDAPRLTAQWGIDFPRSIAFSPDERWVAIANGNSPPTVWNLRSRKKLMTLSPPVRELAGSVEGLAYMADGETLWVFHQNGYAAIWDLQTAQCRKYWQAHQGNGSCLVYDAGEGRVITTGHDGCARVWQGSTGERVDELRHGDAPRVMAASLLGEGDLLATAADDGCIWVWERDGGRYAPKSRYPVPRTVRRTPPYQERPALVKMLASSRQHPHLISATDGKVSWWRLDGGGLRLVRENLTAEEGNNAYLGALNPAGDTLVMLDGGVDPDDENLYLRFQELQTGNLKKRIQAGNWLGFSPSGRYAATTGSEFAGVAVYDTTTWEETISLENLILTPRNLSFSPNSSELAVGYSDGRMACWSLASGHPRLFFSDPGKEPRDMQVRHLGNDTLLSVASSRKARIWGIEPGALRLLKTLDRPKEVEQGAVISPEKIVLFESSFFSGTKFHVFQGQGNQWQVSGSHALGGGLHDEAGKLDGVFVYEPSVAPASGLMLVNTGAAMIDLQSGEQIWDIYKGLDDEEALSSFTQFAPHERSFFTWHTEMFANESTGRLWEIGADRKPRFKRSLGPTRSAARAVIYSADSSEIFVGQWDGEFQVFNAQTGQETGYQRIPGGDITQLAMSPDGSLLAGILEDATIALWRVQPPGGSGDRLEELARLTIDRDRNWMVSSPDNRFDASSLESLSLFSWVFPDDPYRTLGPEVFMRDYYEPRLLPRFRAGEKFAQVRPLKDLNRAQPPVTIASIQPGAEAGSVDVEVTVEAAVYTVQKPGGQVQMETGAYDLRLFREGQLVGQWPVPVDDAPVLAEGLGEVELNSWRAATEVIKAGEMKTLRFKGIKLPRRSGQTTDVEFSAYAFNMDRVKSGTATQRHPLAQAAAAVKPKAFLICVGANSYESADFNLNFAGEDARQMQKSLQARLEHAGFEVVPTLLVSEGENAASWQATKPNIKAALAEVALAATPDDLVLVSFSGHGHTDKSNEFYFMSSDMGVGWRRNQFPAKELLSRCISGEELSRWIRRIDAGEMVLIIDACHSAAVVEQPWFKPGPMGSRGLGQLAYDKRMRVLAASQADDFAIENGTLRQGLLTYALTQDGLEAGLADFRPRDGRITLGEWLAHAVVRVPQLHQKIREKKPLGGDEAGGPGAQALVLTKSVGAGGERPFVAVNDEDLEESSLPKSQAFQTPQFFDYAKDGGLELTRFEPDPVSTK